MISDAAERSRALGEFLRAQRERIAVALETGQHQRRRRTSGLRREEVAASAGISPIWCMRIEQGRAASVSSHALARIAEALHLAPAERAHMFTSEEPTSELQSLMRSSYAVFCLKKK